MCFHVPWAIQGRFSTWASDSDSSSQLLEGLKFSGVGFNKVKVLFVGFSIGQCAVICHWSTRLEIKSIKTDLNYLELNIFHIPQVQKFNFCNVEIRIPLKLFWEYTPLTFSIRVFTSCWPVLNRAHVKHSSHHCHRVSLSRAHAVKHKQRTFMRSKAGFTCFTKLKTRI